MQNFATCLVGFKMPIDFFLDSQYILHSYFTHSRIRTPTPPPLPRAGSDEEHSSTKNEEEMPLTTSTNKTKKSFMQNFATASARKDWSIKNPEDEEDLIEL